MRPGEIEAGQEPGGITVGRVGRVGKLYVDFGPG